MLHYSGKKWRSFRDEIIDLDGSACVRCKRSVLDGVILQVHHKYYLSGKLPWEYPYDACETLCRGCHAREHGHIRPTTGWECVGMEDLGDLVGECDICHSSLRYVFCISHNKWDNLEVGETCCDHLTGTNVAQTYMDTKRNSQERKRQFSTSPRWKTTKDGRSSIQQKNIEIVVEKNDKKYGLRINNIKGKLRFDSAHQARDKVFDLIEGGIIESYLRNVKNMS